jgi:hypothetical protein
LAAGITSHIWDSGALIGMNQPLQIDEKLFQEWVMLYFDRMYDMEKEVLIYRGTIEILKTQVPTETVEAIDRLVQGLRKGKRITDLLDEKYEGYRTQVLEYISQGSLNQALSQYLQEWKAKGPIN